MDRKQFIKTCGLTCFCATSVATLMQSCSASRIITGNIEADELVVSLDHFEPEEGTETEFRKYIIVYNDLIKYPICVFRFNEREYTALWMRCTHQGNELRVFGDMLQCPAHGSEFDNRGDVKNGPAEVALRSFPVTIGKNQIRISLKAV